MVWPLASADALTIGEHGVDRQAVCHIAHELRALLPIAAHGERRRRVAGLSEAMSRDVRRLSSCAPWPDAVVSSAQSAEGGETMTWSRLVFSSIALATADSDGSGSPSDPSEASAALARLTHRSAL